MQRTILSICSAVFIAGCVSNATPKYVYDRPGFRDGRNPVIPSRTKILSPAPGMVLVAPQNHGGHVRSRDYSNPYAIPAQNVFPYSESDSYYVAPIEMNDDWSDTGR